MSDRASPVLLQVVPAGSAIRTAAGVQPNVKTDLWITVGGLVGIYFRFPSLDRFYEHLELALLIFVLDLAEHLLQASHCGRVFLFGCDRHP